MTATLIRIFLALAVLGPAQALGARSPWSAADQAQLRLLASRSPEGPLQGGVEILLEPGWHTYWRNPGESGVPPVFDFAGSENVADVQVFYPAPERYDDGASISLIYRDEVVFPLAITPVEAGQPVRLNLQASFGVCREICIPTRTTSELTVPPSPEPDPLAQARLTRYQPRLPKAPDPGRFDLTGVIVEPEALVIDVLMPDSSYTDLFAEPPQGWSLGQPSFISRADGVSRYRLPLTGRPLQADILGQTFRFVAVAGGEAIEKAVELR